MTLGDGIGQAAFFAYLAFFMWLMFRERPPRS